MKGSKGKLFCEGFYSMSTAAVVSTINDTTTILIKTLLIKTLLIKTLLIKTLLISLIITTLQPYKYAFYLLL